MESELKPVRCGCGGEAESHMFTVGEEKWEAFYICCEECGTKTACQETLTKAIEAWNMSMRVNHFRILTKMILHETESMRPYKVIGDRDSYSEYSQGWNDALAEFESRWDYATSGKDTNVLIKDVASDNNVGRKGELIHCKDCKHYMTIHCVCDGCCISDEWFCAGAEMRK